MRLKIKNYGIIVVGSFILAFGVFNIHAQADLTEGGILGMILFLNRWFGINPSISSLVMDYLLFAIGAMVLGREFLKYSLFASLSFSLFYWLVSTLGPQLYWVSSSNILSAVIGGIFVGIGVGIVVRLGGACGGDDTVALIIKKTTGIKVSITYLIMDTTVLLLSLSYIPLSKIIYSFITVIVSSVLIQIIKNHHRVDE